jgi:ATPase subunit of ABC transporter with duplicated ATPase domains
MVKQVDDDVNIPKSKKDLTSELLRAYEKVAQLGRAKHLRRVLRNLVNEELISKLFENTGGDEYVLCKAKFPDLMKVMSSGESIMFYLFCMLEAEMRYDSLILLDEPETHLHPNAMSELICALDDMLQDYESCCIMVTHSPMLVRELSSDCVYVMEREGKISVVRKPGIETIGADLTMLTDDIFGSREVQRNYKRRIAEMASRMSYAQMVEQVKSKDLPLGLGIELFIRSLYPNGNEEEKQV